MNHIKGYETKNCADSKLKNNVYEADSTTAFFTDHLQHTISIELGTPQQICSMVVNEVYYLDARCG